jgi:hypothetical protein
MPSVRAFVVALICGAVAALLMAWQMTTGFRTPDDFCIVGLALAVFAVFATLAFWGACWGGGNERWLGVAAIVVAVIAVAFSGFPGWMDAVDARSPDPYPSGHRDAQIVLEFLAPALAADLIIWRMTVRNLLKAAGVDPRTRWPWFSIALGAILIFNPLGLDVLSAAVAPSPTDWLAEFWLMISVAGAALLLMLASIEWIVRARTVRRYSAPPKAD